MSTTSNPRVAFELSTARPARSGPAGKRIIAQVVVNVECWPFDKPMPRTILPPPHSELALPDVPNFSWAEYGLRCGLPRLIDVLGSSGISTTASMNAAVIDVYPEVAEAICGAGWEIIGHGFHQQTLQSVDDERAVIRASVAKVAEFTGKRTRGWLGPGLQETFATPDVLRECGVDYVYEWVLDDLPTWLETSAGRLVAVPYALELNDSVLYAVERQPSSAIYERLIDTLATFEAEEGVRVLTLAVHPHLIGVPHRVGYFRRCIEVLCKRDDVVFMSGAEVCDWFRDSSDDG